MRKLHPNSLQYYFFIGTEAELIKLLPVLKQFEEKNVPYKIIASGQNNIQQSALLRFISKQTMDIVLHTDPIKQTSISLALWFMKNFFKGIVVLNKEFKQLKKSNIIFIVHGDTISTVMGAFLGKFYRVRLAHIEAGLRSFNFLNPFPEEIDRVLTSRLTDIHFCPNTWALSNLKERKGIKINTKQNTLIDSLYLVMGNRQVPDVLKIIKNEKFVIFVIHRQENLFNESLVKSVIAKAEEVSKKMKCVFILHKSTEYAFKKMGVLAQLSKNKNILLTPRMSYADFMKVMYASEFMITDGGSNQEESYYMGKPCLILRTHTERTEGLDENVILSKNKSEIIDSFIKEYKKYQRPEVKNRNHPSSIIFETLTKGIPTL